MAASSLFLKRWPMAARPQRKPSVTPVLKMTPTQTGPSQLSSDFANMPQSVMDLVASVAAKAAIKAMQDYTAEPPIGKMAHSAYPEQPERGPMPATIEKRAKSNGVHGGTPKRTRLPEGRRLEARFARGLIRWRLKQGITSRQAAAKQFG